MKSVKFFVLLFAAASVGLAEPPVRIKNFREIFSSYKDLMGNGDAADIQELYRLNKDRLPRLGIPQEFSSSTVLAMTELGGAFCNKVVQKEKTLSVGERVLFSDIDFARGPSQFSTFLINKMSEQMSNLFWMRSARDSEKAAVGKMIQEAGRDDDSVAQTEKVLQLICTTYATSLSFLTK